MIATQELSQTPFHFGTPEQFAALRHLLERSGYTTQGVCERIGIPTIYDFTTLREGRAGPSDVADALDVLIRLFLDGEAVDARRVRQELSDGGVELLADLGLLAPHPVQTDCLAVSVLLYPTEGLYIVSDGGAQAPGLSSPTDPLAVDCVYAAITQNTRNFVRSLPSSPCDQLLELCSGTGIAALLGARSANHAWAVDITERSTRFAEFNARLNGIENLTPLQGDLYAPVAGQSFDRIVAHPPYVPAPEKTYIYAHAGRDGEDVIRAIMAGLPDYLRPGGRFYCTCAATDRQGAPLEQRVREMIGEREAEFDVFLIEHYSFHPTEFYLRLAAAGRITFQKAEQSIELFKELEAERSVYGTIVLQRHRRPRQAITLRRDQSEKATSREIEWLLDWNTAVAEAGGAEGGIVPGVLEARPTVPAHAKLRVTHRAEDGGWKAEQCQVITEYPFPRTVELSSNAAILLATCDGSASTRERLQQLRSQGTVPPELTEEAFVQFVQHLVGEGVLVLEDFAPSEASA
jgi:SAM-dependent methyltransferase